MKISHAQKSNNKIKICENIQEIRKEKSWRVFCWQMRQQGWKCYGEARDIGENPIYD